MDYIEKTYLERIKAFAKEPGSHYSDKIINQFLEIIKKNIYAGWDFKDILSLLGLHHAETIAQSLKDYYDYLKLKIQSEVGKIAYDGALHDLDKDYVKFILEKQAKWSSTQKHEVKDTTESHTDWIKKTYDAARTDSNHSE